MSEHKSKGYVVRGKDDRGNPLESNVCEIGSAVGALNTLVRGRCKDVRIFAVGEDGTETPLPTYEEALVRLSTPDPTPPGEDDHATAARWAGVYHGCDLSKAPSVLREQAITAMLPLVREARMWLTRWQWLAEQSAAALERLSVARLEPLTEAEAEQIARTFTDGLAGFDLPEDVEALTGLLVRSITTPASARRLANGIVANLIGSYFEVGQPDSEGLEEGATEEQLQLLREALTEIQTRCDRAATPRTKKGGS